MMNNETITLQRQPLVFFVGLSSKPDCPHLSNKTLTGKIIEEIAEGLFQINNHKTNLVDFPPVDSNGKLRYPNLEEKKRGWSNLKNEIDLYNPDLLVTLGQQTSIFVRKSLSISPTEPILPSDFSSNSYLKQATSKVLSIHHPSYVYVYRRKFIEIYKKNVILSINALV